MADRRPNLETLFATAIEIESAADRSAYLDEACGEDGALRHDVDRLLQAHLKAASEFLEAPAHRDASTVDVGLAEKVGARIGPYKLLQEIGEGGFGVVYMAEQEDPVRRRVALKIIKPGMDSRDVIARFEAERQALALMEHPNVARVLDGGATSSGRPYFVMDLIKGVPITQYADEVHLTTRERLDLFVEVCQGVQHAHQKGVIHRDLKPSNVLVTLHGSKPVPKVIDFGVAKAIHQRLTERTLYTRYAQMIGTPLYMSPEQAALSGLDVDTRSDVFSLGVLLYELLTGTTPLGKDLTKTTSYDEIRRAIREIEPPVPSRRIETTEIESLRPIAACRGIEPWKIAEQLRGDLDWITMKALEKDRTRRYESVKDLSQDIGRHLADEPVEARPPSKLYRAQKFVRRNRTALVIAACAVLTLAAVIGSFGWLVGERAARRGETARRVEATIGEAEQAIEEHDWGGARLAVLRAQDLVTGEGGERETAARVEEVLRDLDMVTRLEEIRPELSGTVGSLDPRDLARYRRAFADYGLDLETLSASEAAERIRDSRIALELVAGIEEWAAGLKESTRDGKLTWVDLIAIAQQSDPHPLRTRVRELWTSNEVKALAKLAVTEPIEELSVVSIRAIARALEIVGAVNNGATFLKRAERLHPGDSWVNDKLSHFSHQEESWHDALQYALQAVALRPKNASAHHHVGIALGAGFGDSDGAIKAFRDAVRLDPENVKTRNSLGHWLGEKGLLDESIAVFREAIRRIPGQPLLHANFGKTLAKKGQWEEAFVELREAVRLAPEDATSRYSLAYWLHRTRKYEEALTEYREAARLNPRSADYRDGIGSALWMLGRREESLVEYQEAFRINPANSRIRQNVTRNLRYLRRYDEEVEFLEEDLRRRPNHSDVLQELAIALFRRGSHLEATELLRDASNRHPEFLEQGRFAYNAACAAATASSGLGEDSGELDEEARSSLRREALEWLRHSLAADSSLLNSAFEDRDLAAIRDDAELAKLADDEASRLRSFWNGTSRRRIQRLEESFESPNDSVSDELREHRRAVLPDLVTFASIDAALERTGLLDLLPEGANWKYFEGRSEPSKALEWTRAAFDDSDWKEGASGFGYGDDDDRTVLTDMRGNYSTLYLRKSFEIEAPESYGSILLDVIVDDGFVAYLNSEEIGRENAGSAKRLSFDALAPSVSSPRPAPCIDITDTIRPGKNVLAIQVLNQRVTSSDLSLIPVIRGRPRDYAPSDEDFAEFRRIASGDDAARRVAYLEGRLLELRGEHEAARREFEKAAREGERDPRPVLAIVRCLRALGRDDVEERLRAALTFGVRGLDRLWLQTQRHKERRLEEILRSWPEGATPPIQLPRLDEREFSRAVRVDLRPHYNADVVADEGDPQNDALDGNRGCLAVFDFDQRLLRGLPADRHVGVHHLGPYREDNSIQFNRSSREFVRIEIPRGRYSSLRILVAGSFAFEVVPFLSAWLELKDGLPRKHWIPCPDWYWLKNRSHELPRGLVAAWTGMDRWEGDEIEVSGNASIYEYTLSVPENAEVVALRLEPQGAPFTPTTHRIVGLTRPDLKVPTFPLEQTHLNILAVTAIERKE